MAHSVVLALFDSDDAAAAGARTVHGLGIDPEHLSVVARSHEEEGELARRMDGTPGADMEDSRAAGLLGEISARILATIAVVLPGVGSIVAAGPLSAELGEAAGHVAGGIAATLSRAGVDPGRASDWEKRIEEGAILLGVHLAGGEEERVRRELEKSGAREVELARWEGS